MKKKAAADKQNSRLIVLVNESMRLEVEAAAAKADISYAEWIRRAITDSLSEER